MGRHTDGAIAAGQRPLRRWRTSARCGAFQREASNLGHGLPCHGGLPTRATELAGGRGAAQGGLCAERFGVTTGWLALADPGPRPIAWCPAALGAFAEGRPRGGSRCGRPREHPATHVVRVLPWSRCPLLQGDSPGRHATARTGPGTLSGPEPTADLVIVAAPGLCLCLAGTWRTPCAAGEAISARHARATARSGIPGGMAQ